MYLQVLNETSPRPNSLSSLAFGLLSILYEENRPLRHSVTYIMSWLSMASPSWLAHPIVPKWRLSRGASALMRYSCFYLILRCFHCLHSSPWLCQPLPFSFRAPWFVLHLWTVSYFDRIMLQLLGLPVRQKPGVLCCQWLLSKCDAVSFAIWRENSLLVLVDGLMFKLFGC